ncbi:TetR/AcrR family transcriptional regulator [Halorientalis pallida]|uniref:TetR/AcrR family transcriptional regulator n=1 Tax=Halorientalis pallida TaxID=2479928 RepID=A0A498KXW4_9EURY|nr:TetR/AcrR family transcriptional regulator [Halorientalis pallida]RXK50179.1 TetR/AcrR family transcriptional regulator [Halorientalis pallida]
MGEESVPSDTKAAVAGAVRQALAEHGYARLTTAKIAAESELSEAGLYYHYDSKDEMVVAFLETAAGFLRRELDALDAEDPETRLRQACDHLFTDRADTERRGVDVAVMELLAHAPHNETLQEPLLALEGDTIDALTEILEDGVTDGTFDESVDPRATAAFLVAAADGATGFYLSLGMDVGESLPDAVGRYVDSLLATAD